MATLEQLQEEFAALKTRFEAQVQENADLRSRIPDQSDQSVTPTPNVVQPIYVTSTMRLETFKGATSDGKGPDVLEWVGDVRSQLTSRRMKGEQAVAFIVEHTGGKARQEIKGRGKLQDPEEVLRIQLKVFGDNQSLSQLLQRFYTYRQADDEDLIGCSLKLLGLSNRICPLDAAFKASKDKTLKARFADAVRDEALQRELRRLNVESPGLTFFELRDRVVDWVGPSGVKGHRDGRKQATVQEARGGDSSDGEVLRLLKQHEVEMKEQQTKLDHLMASLSKKEKTGNSAPRKQRQPLLCYICRSPDHLRAKCPFLPMIESGPAGEGQNASKPQSN
ncbi:hypothetical protein HOLleu_05151 [Holothuria leucospilota]|uniref:Uncharacterized protein n=1 Tax=Holothuria leucospilota TaxID=206669 RepID=A0A9Q1CJM7_HOLLE|nr:hypothetical protein HOLleu_05151 [Holothuria leucospilota]